MTGTDEAKGRFIHRQTMANAMRFTTTELAELESKAAERIGKIAIAAGLGDLDIDDAAMRKEFEAIASKFRKGEAKQAAPVPAATGAN